MLEAKMQEPYSIKILNDLATVAIAMQSFVEAVRPLPALVLLNIYWDAASVMNCPVARSWPTWSLCTTDGHGWLCQSDKFAPSCSTGLQKTRGAVSGHYKG